MPAHAPRSAKAWAAMPAGTTARGWDGMSESARPSTRITATDPAESGERAADREKEIGAISPVKNRHEAGEPEDAAPAPAIEKERVHARAETTLGAQGAICLDPRRGAGSKGRARAGRDRARRPAPRGAHVTPSHSPAGDRAQRGAESDQPHEEAMIGGPERACDQHEPAKLDRQPAHGRAYRHREAPGWKPWNPRGETLARSGERDHHPRPRLRLTGSRTIVPRGRGAARHSRGAPSRSRPSPPRRAAARSVSGRAGGRSARIIPLIPRDRALLGNARDMDQPNRSAG